MLRKSYIKYLILIIIILAGVYLVLDYHESTTIGSDNVGYVVKNTYSHYSNPNTKIAIVSGMHSRETLSSTVLPYVVKAYSLLNNVEIVNYQVTVLDNPNDFDIGRRNGETLVHDYVVSDVDKSDFDLVIIGHDHEKGYGEGFYIATPSMDSKSVQLAESVMNELPDFNYYKRNANQSPQSSSITRVDNPIVKTGTALFVYEIPEWLGFHEAFVKTYALFDSSVKSINKK